MAHRKKSSRRWPMIVLLMLLAYGGTFAWWSRLHTRGTDVAGRTMWSFFAMPSGLPMLSYANWREWKRNETIAATVFWPCVLIDERLTKRRYWPAAASEPRRVLK